MNERRRFLQVVGGSAVAMGMGCGATASGTGAGAGGAGGELGAGGTGTGGTDSGTGGTGTGGTTTTTGSATNCTTNPPGTRVGTPSDYAGDGLHIATSTGFLIGRDAGGLYALSAICTHQQCDMSATDAQGPFGQLTAGGQDIQCLCHGSKFGPTGAVLQGPAPTNRPLKAYALALGCDGHLYVNKAQVVASSVRLMA